MGVIDTEHLLGAPVGQDDFPFLVEMFAREQVTWGIGGNRTEEQVRERLAGWMRHQEDHGFGAVMFRDRRTGERVGWGGLQHSMIDGQDRITVGYVIRPESWGQGYATEIAVASVHYAFEVLGLDRVYASAEAANTASRRVLEKAGLRLHREIDHGGYVEAIYTVSR